MKNKWDEIIGKTVKMPRHRLEHLKMIAYMKHIPTMRLINDTLQQLIEENANLIQSYNDLCDVYPD